MVLAVFEACKPGAAADGVAHQPEAFALVRMFTFVGMRDVAGGEVAPRPHPNCYPFQYVYLSSKFEVIRMDRVVSKALVHPVFIQDGPSEPAWRRETRASWLWHAYPI